MGDKTKIEWTDASWTPIRARNLQTGKIGWHCEHDTTGCEHCYSERLNERLGTGLTFKPGHRKDIEIFLDEKMLTAPLRWKRPRMIFVCSMTDLFAEFVKEKWIDKMFAVMALCPQHTFQVLSKRAERMRDYLTAPFRDECWIVSDTFNKVANPRVLWRCPLPNVWLGVSAERQDEFDERQRYLRETPAAVRFFSLEPLLAPINVARAFYVDEDCEYSGSKRQQISWVIIGGESGPHARPLDVDWARSILAQCREAGVSCFMKQLGSKPMLHGFSMPVRHSKGGDPTEWPDDLRTREMPA